MSRKDRITVISLCAVAGVLLISTIIALIFMSSSPQDDGLIRDNVYVAGVNVGGMTREQAKELLQDAAENYSILDMVVEVLDSRILLRPADTAIRLDVDAAVNAAYDYGRTGDKIPNQPSHTVSVLPYLNLDTDYIRSQITALGTQYGTLRQNPTVRVEGPAPSKEPETYDTEKVYQTMFLFMGTAEYDFSTEELYEQILDAYDSSIFEVVGKCSVLPPETSVIEVLEQAYAQYCRESIDAVIDENYTVTKEVYGYGFDLDSMKDKIAVTPYGETLEIPMTYLRPDITAEELTGALFQDVLGSYTNAVEANNNLVSNIHKVLESLNGMILKAGEEFSFNELVGETTRQRGYKPFSQYVGTVYTEDVYGGGISQVASLLYACALQADLEVLERHTHAYAPSFIQAGLDADILYGSMDLRFRNSTMEPIRILAAYENGMLSVQFLGTDNKDFTIEITFVTDKVYKPATLIQTMPQENSVGYKGGEILQEGITGYNISVYKHCTYKVGESEEEVQDPEALAPFDLPVGQSHYEKRNIIQIELYEPPTTEPTTEPTSKPTVESSVSTTESEPSASTGVTGPSQTDAPTTVPTESTASA